MVILPKVGELGDLSTIYHQSLCKGCWGGCLLPHGQVKGASVFRGSSRQQGADIDVEVGIGMQVGGKG